MNDEHCLIQGCTAKVYAPAGTRSVCKEHFLQYLTWRRRRGPQMFNRYAAMTMEERDAVSAEWQKTVRIEEIPSQSSPKA